jgi:1D-myo-inositol-tetrakisphosphate 5-kinase/inositol-polyphosphate multikinase
MSSSEAASKPGAYDTSALKLKAFSNAAAGHDGVLSDESGEVIIKPCTAAEIAFYQASASEHPDFYELMPTMMGTLQLGQPSTLPEDLKLPDPEAAELTQEYKDQKLLHGKALKTETAIVLENLEHGFVHPNVLDLKLGARLYDPSTTAPEKGARLDKVSSETTSGSLNYRIAGMKVWNPAKGEYAVYDKFYGRQFTPETIKSGFETFFSCLLPSSSTSPEQTSSPTSIASEDAHALLELLLADVAKARHVLSRLSSRMYGASILFVYEGDIPTLSTLLGTHAPPEKAVPKKQEVAPTSEEISALEEEEEEEEEPKVAYRVRMIDFAHAKWLPKEEGKDENLIEGLRNVEGAVEEIVGRFV